MQTIGLITADDRTLLHRAAETVALLPVAGCSQLAAACHHLSQVSPPLRRDLVEHTLTLADQVHRALIAEAAPDRWLPDLETLGTPARQAVTIVADLIDERTGQAHRVDEVRDVCSRLLAQVAVLA